MKWIHLFAASMATASAAPVPYDVVVYGGTSGGVAAATQVARSGKSVVLISPTAHLGGLTTSGLGWTDLGASSILGGISREFYQGIYDHYENDTAWNWQTRASYGNNGQGGPAFNHTTRIASVFEPRVAEAIFNRWIADESIPVITGRLDLDDGVSMDGSAIDFIRLEDGREFSAKMFIDASYEGDLLPGAGVSFTVGREANSVYNESVSGIQATRATKNQLPDGIDPYVIPGDSTSGLLKGVNADAGGVDGAGDERLQAYCYRMVLTDVPANRTAINQPPGYQESDYELVFRAIGAGQTSGFFKLDLMPNRKTDSNNTGGISTDFIGMNYGQGWNWATLDHDERAALAKQHENWQRGLVWTLQNHPRVPEGIRNNYARWGLPADEFADNGHWPYQLYVREARRMVSDHVMTQHHCTGAVAVSDSIGLAAYTMDSHHVQRHVKNGMVKNEGDVQLAIPGPYPVSYRSIIPKRGECTNLLVPWSLSSSHMAFGSIRMEPVFMTLSQSAAIAASMAIDGDMAVQDVRYPQLRQKLVSAEQALGDPVSAPPEFVIDNTHPSLVSISGEWLSGFTTAGFIGVDYFHDNQTGQGAKQVSYQVPAEITGTQQIYMRWTSHANRASNIPVEIRHRDGVETIYVDQRSDGAKWNALGVYDFSGSPDQGVTIKTTAANGYVVADAVGFTAIPDDVDTDGDGISDAREAVLGLDPLVSDAAFIAAVGENPEFFGLHGPNEIYQTVFTSPQISAAGAAGTTLQFGLFGEGSNGQWETLESFNVPFESDAAKRFFRLGMKSEPAGLVAALSAGEARKIVVYGTSLTANGAWVGGMNDWLTSRYPGEATVINSGLSGKNSAAGLSQLDEMVLSHQPDTVFIEFAMNDAFRYNDGTPSLSVDEARTNLLAMIDAIQMHPSQAEIILQTMNPVWDSPSGSNQSATLRPDLAAYYQMYRFVAAERGLLLIDHHQNWVKLQESDDAAFRLLVPDGVHPVAQGIAQVVAPLLQWKLGGGPSER